MIELIPAIDIFGGRCVRLTQGDYNTKKEYGDPLFQAVRFERLGFKRLHIVDLDGAKNKHVVNIDILRSITSHTRLAVDFGGGIKTDDDIKRVFDCGAAFAVIGSVAVTSPDTYLRWINTYGSERIILGADVRDGMVSINGWTQTGNTSLNELLARFIAAGTRNVLCTDIGRDGMLGGPAIGLYKDVMRRFPSCRLIASGGVSRIADIEALSNAGVPAVVFGKAIYEGRIDMNELADRCLQRE